MGKTKAIFKCPKEYKEKFAESDCLLTISVGQTTQDGELFGITMNKINESFSSCTILVGDTLQRYNMASDSDADGKTHDSFDELAVKEGDLWLARNEQFYNKLSIPIKIVRWNELLNHSDYTEKLNEVKKAISIDSEYKDTFDKSIGKYLKKYSERFPELGSHDLERVRQLSYDFVLEECAALCLWPELQCHFEIYSNRHNDAVIATRERFVCPHYPDLLRPVVISFKSAAHLVGPQRFVTLKKNH